MASRHEVWVTRTEPGASATAARLAERGVTALVAPLLQVLLLAPPPGSDPEAGAVAFTSANGVRGFAKWWDRRDVPVFAVGAATAAAARAQGFAPVRSADGDVQALARLLAEARPVGRVLHPCGRERAGDLAAAVAGAGIAVDTLPVYETRAVRSLPEAAVAALGEGRLDAVLLHSPKAARTLAALLGPEPRFDLSGVRALGLSPACLAPLQGLGLRRSGAAPRPEEAALLELLA